jgi:uncharacterized membrane protein
MIGNSKGKYFSGKLSAKQCSDTGMAMVLLLLLTGYFTGTQIFYILGIPVLVINMILPRLFYPVAYVWLGFTNLMGTIMSKIILTIVFVVLVIPVGLVRRLFKKDSLLLTKFKKSRKSVMITRNHCFSATDIERPY